MLFLIKFSKNKISTKSGHTFFYGNGDSSNGHQEVDDVHRREEDVHDEVARMEVLVPENGDDRDLKKSGSFRICRLIPGLPDFSG
jgi:hypothetical protein